jgi:hypothetical protein
MRSIGRSILPVLLIAAVIASSGCVRRTVTIDSQPPGAIVWMNDREVGRTPVDVDFLFYGRYDVRLVKEGYEPKLTSGRVRAPLWDNPPFDLFAELMPMNLHSRSHLSYELDERDDDTDALKDRARELRSRTIISE